jgi:ADP-ribose pyrophosphatase YjhB (NUDIX family)
MNFEDSYLGRLRKEVGSRLLIMPGFRAVVEDRAGRVLLQKRRDFGVWGLPGGSPDEGESVSMCIEREVFEETGLRLRHFHVFGFASDPNFELTVYPNGHQVHSYALLVWSGDWTGQVRASDEESSETRFFAVDKIPEMLRSEKITLKKYLLYKRTGEFQLD